jgi:hypothetical protein
MPSRDIEATQEPGGTARPLSEILGTLVAEFVKAAANRDLNEAYWRQIYKDHSALAAFEPSRVRIVGATVSLPVAIDEVGDPAPHDIGLSAEQIGSVLSDRFPAAQRREAAERIRARLVEHDGNRFANRELATDLATLAAEALPGFVSDRDFDAARLASFEDEARSLPPSAAETRFLYRTADLERLRPELVVRMDLTLGID